MKKILFRGKRIDNGELVHGHLAQYVEGVKATINTEDFCPCEEGRFICVDPDTVDFYTEKEEQVANATSKRKEQSNAEL